MNLAKAIEACIQNGNRLLDDAIHLNDFDSFPSAHALAKLAQEEFAKSYILRLVESKALYWTPELRKSLSHHVSKQLVGVVIDFLNPDTDVFIEAIKNNKPLGLTKEVADALNIYVHELMLRWQSDNWVWVEAPQYSKVPKSIFKGTEEKQKQNSIYVSLSEKGEVANLPSATYDGKKAGEEIERARRYASFVRSTTASFQEREIIEVLKLISIKTVIRYVTGNREQLQKSKIAACYYCQQSFPASEVQDYFVEGNDRATVLCPRCGIDSVIGDKSGLDFSEENLEDLHQHWFGIKDKDA